MSLKNLRIFNIRNKSLCHENYFELTPNYSFTNFRLKQKRILAFLLRKVLMIPDLQSLAFQILSYFLNTYNMSIEKIEEDFCEVSKFNILKKNRNKF